MNSLTNSPRFSSFYFSDCIRDAKGKTEADHDREWKEATAESLASIETKLAELLKEREAVTTQLSLFGESQVKTSKPKATKPQQMNLFGQAEVAQFGVIANPRMDISSGKLGMIIEDTRTEQEKEAAIEAEAKSLTQQLF